MNIPTVKGLLLAFIISFVMSPVVQAADVSARIVNGIDSQDHPSTGALLSGGNPDTAFLICSGTQIGCNTFLTAGHCVCDTVGSNCQPGDTGQPNPGNFSVFLQHAGIFSVTNIDVHPSFNFPTADIAVITLGEQISGTSPTPINTVGAPVFGSTGDIVGFGNTISSFFESDAGIKRAGKVITENCGSPAENQQLVCWSFDNPVGAPGQDSNTCTGDSGGPLFIDMGNGPVVAGVTSGGTAFDCQPVDDSYDSNVFTYSNYIQAMAGADLNNTSCGPLPQVGEPGTSVSKFSSVLTSANTNDSFVVSVLDSDDLLRVSMNADDDGTADFDLYVKQGSPPTPGDFDCAKTGAGQFGICEFDLTAVGADDFHIVIARTAGSGQYQVTGTRFGAPVAGDITAALDSIVTTVVPGEPFPFDLDITNTTGQSADLDVVLSIILPNTTEIPLVEKNLSLNSGSSLLKSLALPIPSTAPDGAYQLKLQLTDPITTDIVSEDILDFNVFLLVL